MAVVKTQRNYIDYVQYFKMNFFDKTQ